MPLRFGTARAAEAPPCFRGPKENAMNPALRPHPTGAATAEADMDCARRCEHVLELLLTHRGHSLCEVDRVLADKPQSVFGHRPRAALIVLADDDNARSKVAASVGAIETAYPDMDAPARRHAAAARAWLEGDSALAVERYGAIVID